MDIADKGIIHLIHGESSATMHYILENGLLYSLTLNSSNKVADIKKDSKAQVAFGKITSDKNDVEVTIISDNDKVKAQFDKMLDMNFTHFKTFDDDLVILEMKLI